MRVFRQARGHVVARGRASPLPAPEMAKTERPPSHISAARSSERITTVGSGRSTFRNSWGTNADLALGPSRGQFPKVLLPDGNCPRDGPSARSAFVPHEFPKVLLSNPTVVILSPDCAAEMCDGRCPALAISGGKEWRGWPGPWSRGGPCDRGPRLVRANILILYKLKEVENRDFL
jgi:hypothetical protein